MVVVAGLESGKSLAVVDTYSAASAPIGRTAGRGCLDTPRRVFEYLWL
jgi:hypothetical protein